MTTGIPESASERAAFLQKLGFARYRDASPALIRALLEHDDPQCVHAGASAAIANPSPDMARTLELLYWQRREQEAATGQPDGSAASIMNAVHHLDPANLAVLFDAAGSRNSTSLLAIMALGALHSVNHPQTAAFARMQLQDPRDSVREYAIPILLHSDPDAFDEVRALLDDPSTTDRIGVSILAALLDSAADDRHATALDIAFDWLTQRAGTTLPTCLSNLQMKHPKGYGALAVRLFDEADPSRKDALLRILLTGHSPEVAARLCREISTGPFETARRIISELAGYEPEPGWNDQLRHAIQQRPDDVSELRSIIDEKEHTARTVHPYDR